MQEIRIEPETVATIVSLPLAAAEIASKLTSASQNLLELADNIEKLTAIVCTNTFRENDPLAAIHPERGVGVIVDEDTAAVCLLLADAFRLAQIYSEAELVEYMVGDEELMQAIALLKAVGIVPAPPLLHSVPTGP